MRVELYDSEHLAFLPKTLEEEQIIRILFPQAKEKSTRLKKERSLVVRFDNWMICDKILKIYG